VGLKEDLLKIEAKLNKDIDDVLQTRVADGAKKAITASAQKNVYDAYSPVFWSRRMWNGGLLDERQISVHVANGELTLTDDAPWQHLKGGFYPKERLADMIAEGNPRFFFGDAGPRPFHEAAEKAFSKSGDFERTLASGLAVKGYKTR
jgi:hypothetical protein